MVSFITVILGALSLSAFSIVAVLINFLYRNGKYEHQRKTQHIVKASSNELVDILRPGWCQSLLEHLTESCCHLFDYISRQQGKEPWGTILDAGTGTHSLEWLLGLKNEGVTAITGDPKRQAAMESIFKTQLRPCDHIVTGNWKDSKLLQGQVFDTVLADYLLGSLDGYAPYFQDRLFERLKPHVGKKLYVVGAEPFPDSDDSAHGQLIIDIAKLRDACILLAGDRPYREYPLDWVVRNLKQLGYRIHNVAFFETTHNQETKLARMKNSLLADAMQNQIDKLRKQVCKMKWGIKFGSDYIVVASPNGAKGQESSQVKEVMGTYQSPIEMQNTIYPRDEE